MHFSQAEAEFTLSRARALLAANPQPSPALLGDLWLTLMTVRAQALTNSVRSALGDRVCAGPFAGMKLTDAAFVTYAALALGVYEHELHETVEAIIAKGYRRIANIGCSLGYYAVGLARRMPGTAIDAFDIDAAARTQCAEMASLNDVSARVRVQGLFAGAQFAAYHDGGAPNLILMDIEGGEFDLLDPVTYPALRKLDVLVELHELTKPGLTQEITARFAPTHDLRIIETRNRLPDLSHLIPDGQCIDLIDHALLGWESRGGPTPWGLFTVKN